MPKITIGKTIEDSSSRQVFIDGKLLDEGCFSRTISIYRQESYELICKCSIDEIFAHFDQIGVEIEEDLNHDRTDIDVPYREDLSFQIQSLWMEKKNNFKEMVVISRFAPFDWSFSWSIREFVDVFSSIYLNTRNSPFYYGFRYEHAWEDELADKLLLTGVLKDGTYFSDFGGVINELVDIVNEVHNMAIAQLNTGVSSNSLAELFDFPEDVKTACTQYLQYFYEFLKDVGIKAKVAVTEQDSGEVLFSVIPDDKDSALENIREALNIYLRLPNSQIDADMSDLTVQSLNAQIFHLKGQLTLAAATIQQQQSTIQNLQLRSISPDVLVLSQQGSEKDEEPLLGGLIKVGEAQLGEGAVSINLAALLRWLKQKFGKAES